MAEKIITKQMYQEITIREWLAQLDKDNYPFLRTALALLSIESCLNNSAEYQALSAVSSLLEFMQTDEKTETEESVDVESVLPLDLEERLTDLMVQIATQKGAISPEMNGYDNGLLYSDEADEDMMMDDDEYLDETEDIDGNSANDDRIVRHVDIITAYLNEGDFSHELLTFPEEQALGELIIRGKQARRELHNLQIANKLSKELEDELQAVIKDSENALHTLITRNLRLVISIAKHFQGRGLSLDDLVQAGNIGLIKAAHRFDPTENVKFASYATYWIRQTISREASNYGRTIRIPINQLQTWGRINRISSQLEQVLGREPNPSEIAAASQDQFSALGVPLKPLSENKIKRVLASVTDLLSLDAHEAEGEDDKPVVERLTEIDGTHSRDFDIRFARQLLMEFVEHVRNNHHHQDNEIHAVILFYAFGLDGRPYSNVEIARLLTEQGRTIGRERVRQIVEQYKPKLLEYLAAHQITSTVIFFE